MKYKHIVFDIDGTLIDTEYAVINSLIKTITEIPQFGITECLIQYKCSVNTPPPHSIRSW